jgi:hypothetical protein
MFEGIRHNKFFLTAAGEYHPLTSPRECSEIRRLRDTIRDDYMLVRIEPSFRDERSSPMDIDRLVISTRLKPHSLYPITDWPCHVYVMRIVDDHLLEASSFTETQEEMIAWGTLFKTLAEAQRFALAGR